MRATTEIIELQAAADTLSWSVAKHPASCKILTQCKHMNAWDHITLSVYKPIGRVLRFGIVVSVTLHCKQQIKAYTPPLP